MASTYVNDLRLEEIGTGEQSGTWGATTNTNLELIAEAFSYGSEAIANASTHTITVADGASDEARSFYMKCTGGGQASTVTLAPNTLSKVWMIENATSYTLTFTQGSGANVAILAGEVKMIATDGGGSTAVIYDLFTDVNLAGTTKVAALTTSGNVSVGGNLDVTGTFDLSDSNFTNAGNIQLDSISGDADTDTSITFSGSDVITIANGGTGQVTFNNGSIVPVTDNDIDLGTSSLEFKDAYFDGTVTTDAIVADTADINGGTVDGAVIGGASAAAASVTTLAASGAITGSSTVQGTTITATSAFVPGTSDGAALGTTSLEFSDLFLADSSVINLGADQDVSLTHVHDTGILLNSTRQLQFGDSGTYIHQSADGVLDLVSDTEIEINATTIDINGAVDVSGEIAAASLDISGNVDIDGTTNLDAVDIDGAVQLDATFTVGANDQGYDVILYGDSASANMTWDTSADDLILNGAAGLIVPDGQLTLGSTAVTSTAAEINLIDGGTSRGTTAVASGDGILINDAGTMRMTNVDTVSTYFSSHNVGGGNVVTTGALNSGSITSGFGTIDTGSSTITTTGVITGGTLEATTDTAAGDNAAIGYTAAEGLILTGQGSTNDVTIKNDADTIVMRVPTGTDDVVFTDNVTISGDLTVSGDTTTVSTTNMVVSDNLIELNNGASSNANDSGIVIERGSTGDNAIFMWDESADTFVLGTTTATGSATGNISVTDGALQAGSLDISGNIDVDGTANLDVVDIDGAVDMATTLAVAGNVDFNGDLDVDGTTNLDAVDIDGAVDMATTLSVTGNVTLGGQLIMPDVTSTKILVADGTSYQEVAVSGDVTIANTGAVTIAANAVEGSMLNDNTISGQTALTSGLATDDELLVSDGGTLKRMDVSVLTTLTDDNATALAIALG
jgi:cytoskeletal protein CcmA (bactofilin family)